MGKSDICPGFAGVSWIAIAELSESRPYARVRPESIQPQHFQSDGARGHCRRGQSNTNRVTPMPKRN
jgi:hypothetical protein